MTLVPAFEVGIWNGWIPAIILFLFMMLSGVVSKDVAEKITPAEEVKARNGSMMIVFFGLIIYSIFLPLQLWTAWFYAGLAVYLSGILISLTALFNVSAAKKGEPFTTGMYRFTRHPISLGTLLAIIGIGIATASWLFLVFSAVLAVISHFIAVIEEQATIRKFGDAYREYMERTLRWIGIPK